MASSPRKQPMRPDYYGLDVYEPISPIQRKKTKTRIEICKEMLQDPEYGPIFMNLVVEYVKVKNEMSTCIRLEYTFGESIL